MITHDLTLDHPILPSLKAQARRSFLTAGFLTAAALALLTLLLEASDKPTGTGGVQTSPEPSPVAIELAFITHLEANIAEQDVYLERDSGSGEVFRPTAGDHDMKAPLFAAAETVPHNPFDSTDIGPYPKGEPLHLTLGEWLAHRGTGVYRYQDGTGTLELDFEGLVPNGVYTLWHAFLPAVPPEPFTGTLDLPLGAADGSESVFRADAEGKATFTHSFRPGLEMSDAWTNAILALNYHSDGKTHGGHPGAFGLNAHIPLFAMLPKRRGIK